MSMLGSPAPGRGDTGEVVATFTTYEAAQKAVSSLIAAEVPARDIAIVGQGLRSIERVTGKLGYATAARSGAVNGILLGLLFSAFFVLGQPDVPIQLFVGVMFVGVALGMLMSIAVYSIVRRRRDYASVMQVMADSYEVTVAPATSGKARQVLGPRAGAAPARPAPVPAPVDVPEPDAPPQYGERLPVPDAPRDPEPGGDPSDAPVAAGPDEPVSPAPAPTGPGEPAPGPGIPDPGEPAPGPGTERPPTPPAGVPGTA